MEHRYCEVPGAHSRQKVVQLTPHSSPERTHILAPICDWGIGNWATKPLSHYAAQQRCAGSQLCRLDCEVVCIVSGFQTKNFHSLQSGVSRNKISKFQKMEKTATFLTLAERGVKKVKQVPKVSYSSTISELPLCPINTISRPCSVP